MRLSVPAAVSMLLIAFSATAGSRSEVSPLLPAPSRGQADPNPGVCGLATADRTKTSVENCTRCHDGSIPGPLNGLVSTHPVDFDYAAAQARRPAELNPVSSLPPEVKLSGGKLTCTTCHDGRSSLEYRLAAPVSPRPSKLCLSCHYFP